MLSPNTPFGPSDHNVKVFVVPVPVPVFVIYVAKLDNETVLVTISPLAFVPFIVNVSTEFSSLNGKLGYEYIIAICCFCLIREGKTAESQKGVTAQSQKGNDCFSPVFYNALQVILELLILLVLAPINFSCAKAGDNTVLPLASVLDILN